MPKRISILFVCLGNICRSPTGEGVFKKLAADRGLADRFTVDSAGTGNWHVGEEADSRMYDAAFRRGYRLDSRARQFSPKDFERFDLIVAMDRENRSDILALDRRGQYKHKVKLMCDYLSENHIRDVPDPYYGGGEGFDKVITLLEKACNNLLDSLD